MQEVFNSYKNYLKAERNASRYTIRNYVGDLMGNYKRGPEKGFFQFLKLKKVDSLKEVDKQVVRDYLAYLGKQGTSKRSIARKLSAIRSFYRYLVREGIVSTSPIPISRERGGRPASFSIKLDRRLPSFLTVEEMVRLLKAPDSATPQGQRDQALIELIYAAGLRVSELVNLNREQINLDSREIRVWGKGAKERMVLMGEPAAIALSSYLSQGRPKLAAKKVSDALFLNRNGGRLTERMVQKILGRYAREAGIDKRVYPHLLRHTFATHLLDGGADLRVVQELLGHTNLASTQIYTHVTLSRARKVYRSAHPMAHIEENELEDRKQD